MYGSSEMVTDISLTKFNLNGLFFTVLISGTDLALETTNSDGYAITVPAGYANSSGVTIFTLEFIQPAQPLSLLTLIVVINPTPSLFHIDTNTFAVTTNQPLSVGVYQFILLLFDPSLGISPPFPVHVIVTVASPGEFHIVCLKDMIALYECLWNATDCACMSSSQQCNVYIYIYIYIYIYTYT